MQNVRASDCSANVSPEPQAAPWVPGGPAGLQVAPDPKALGGPAILWSPADLQHPNTSGRVSKPAAHLIPILGSKISCSRLVRRRPRWDRWVQARLSDPVDQGRPLALLDNGSDLGSIENFEKLILPMTPESPCRPFKPTAP